jgi:hypothetical protein
MTVLLCSFTGKRIELYTIKLSKFEVEELKNVIIKGSHSSQAFRALYILLNCDKGEFSKNAEIKNSDICIYELNS